MRSGLNFVFWGLLLLIVDFRINGFDLLPDLIGLILMAAGCSALASRSRQFGHAYYLVIAMGVLWVLAFFATGNDVTWLGYASTFCNCWMIWAVCGGIRDVATEQQHFDLAESAQVRRIIYVALSVALFIGPRFIFNPFTGLFGLVFSVIWMLTIVVMLLTLVSRASRQLT